MASIMRLRRRFIFSKGVSFTSVLFSVLAFGSAGLAKGERKLISTGGGGSGAAFVLLNRSNIQKHSRRCLTVLTKLYITVLARWDATLGVGLV